MLWNALLLALREIRRNVLRSFLTVLGIVIGVASVITMVNLGTGPTAKVTEQIASLGSNLLIVRTGQRLGPGMREAAPPFKLADAQAIWREVGGLAAVRDSFAWGSTLANWKTGASTCVEEPFLLSALRQTASGGRRENIFNRIFDIFFEEEKQPGEILTNLLDDPTQQGRLT